MTALSDLIASLIVNPRLPDDILLAVPPRRPGETDTQLRKRTVLITNITALKAREAAR